MEIDIYALLTIINKEYQRISMHGIRRELLLAQAQSLSIPLVEVSIPKRATNVEYENAMREAMLPLISQGIDAVVFGDIFLEDVRRYREEKLAAVELKAVFPLWGEKTKDLASEFIHRGFKARIACVDTHNMDAAFAGREFDHALMNDLPKNIDPCGENGEFHTFVYDAPIFSQPVPFKMGDVVLRDDRFCFCDFLQPGEDL